MQIPRDISLSEKYLQNNKEEGYSSYSGLPRETTTLKAQFSQKNLLEQSTYCEPENSNMHQCVACSHNSNVLAIPTYTNARDISHQGENNPVYEESSLAFHRTNQENVRATYCVNIRKQFFIYVITLFQCIVIISRKGFKKLQTLPYFVFQDLNDDMNTTVLIGIRLSIAFGPTKIIIDIHVVYIFI